MKGAEGMGKKERFAHCFMAAALAGHFCLPEGLEVLSRRRLSLASLGVGVFPVLFPVCRWSCYSSSTSPTPPPSPTLPTSPSNRSSTASPPAASSYNSFGIRRQHLI